MPDPTFLEIAASIYMHGGRFGIDDEGTALIIHPATRLPDELIKACAPYDKEIRDLVLNGMNRTLNASQPAINPLEQNDRQRTDA